jgi:hypothetical protein
VYVHLLDQPDRTLALPPLPRAVKAARLLKDGRAVAVQTTPAGVTLQLPDAARDAYDTVVVLDMGGR